MKKLICLVGLIVIVSLFLADETIAQDTELDLVKVTLNNYLQGHITGKPEFIRQAFFKDVRITAFREGKLLNLDIEEFASRFNGNPANDEAKRKRKIENISISGNAAIAKITLDYPTVKFTDYMTLLKINSEWKIVNKSFYAKPVNETEKVNFKSAADEKNAVEATLNYYLKAQATGNAEFLRKAFHKDARIMSFRSEKMNNLSIDEFAGFFKGSIATDESQRQRRIESIDISGNAAIAKIILDYPTIKFTDFMSLLKIEGEWKIVNKSFYAEPKQK